MKNTMWYWIGGSALLLASLLARLSAYPIVVSDYTYFVAKWFSVLAAHPWLSGFQNLQSDYAPLYLYLLKLVSGIPVSSLYSSKTLAFVFDVLIALGIYLILKRYAPPPLNRAQLFFCFVLILSIPTVMINSSLWDQSDAFYGAGIIFSLYAILLDFPLWAAIAFGIALSFKIQAIFFAPIFLGYLLQHPKRWWYIVVPPVVFALSVIPAWLGGASFWSEFTIYLHQAQEYPWLDVSSQSIYAFTNNVSISASVQTMLFWIGIIVSGLCGLGILLIIARNERLTPLQWIYLSLVCMLIIPYFLPRMHERYFYMGDILSVLYAIYRPRQWIIPVLVVLISFLSYMPFLAKQVSWFSALQGMDLRIPATMLGLVLIYLLWQWRGTMKTLSLEKSEV